MSATLCTHCVAGDAVQQGMATWGGRSIRTGRGRGATVSLGQFTKKTGNGDRCAGRRMAVVR